MHIDLRSADQSVAGKLRTAADHASDSIIRNLSLLKSGRNLEMLRFNEPCKHTNCNVKTENKMYFPFLLVPVVDADPTLFP